MGILRKNLYLVCYELSGYAGRLFYSFTFFLSFRFYPSFPFASRGEKEDVND